MARDRRPQPQVPEADQSASAPASFVSAWLIALGLIAGLLFGLALSWALGPPPERNTQPHQLRADHLYHYLVAIALEYQFSGDTHTALRKLIALRPGQDPFQELADAACELSRGDYLRSESGESGLRAAVQLYRAQGRSGCADLILPQVDDVVAAEAPHDPPANVTAPPLSLPTKTPLSRPPQPTATLRVVATAVPQRGFVPLPARTFCDPDRPALMEVYTVDYLGRGIPGQRIRVRWSDGEDTFISGLKPERGDGYADFQMDEGIGYIVDMPGASVALGAELSTGACFAPNGSQSLKSWRVTFRSDT